MLGKLKRLLQRTLFYKWYLLLCKHYRFWVGSSEYNKAEFAILLDGVVQEAKNLGIEVKSEEEINSILKEME